MKALIVVVRQDIDPGLQLAQAVHAAAELALRWRIAIEVWDAGSAPTVVVLGARDSRRTWSSPKHPKAVAWPARSGSWNSARTTSCSIAPPPIPSTTPVASPPIVPPHYSGFTSTEQPPGTCTHCAAREKLQVMGEPVMRQKGKRTIFVSYKLKAGVYLEDASGVYVATCPALDLVSQGETHDEARRAIDEAATMYLKHCCARGILDGILDGLGFEPAGDEEIEEDDEFVDVRELKDFEVFDIEVPLHLITSKGGAEAWAS